MSANRSGLEASLDSPVDGIRYRVIFEERPFDSGACKLAFKGRYRGNGPKNGTQCVTKIFKDEAARHYQNYQPDLSASHGARAHAQAFNSDYTSNKPLRFIVPQVATVDQVGGGSRFVKPRDKILVEDFIEGRFEKFNSNGGWCSDDVASIPAFSHYTYWKSNGELLVCDIQGVRYADGYVLTDPAVHSRTQGLYGPTDLGPTGMTRFFQSHKCTSICSRFPKPTFSGHRRINRGRQQRRSSTYTFMLDDGEAEANRFYANRQDLPDIVEETSFGTAAGVGLLVGAGVLLVGALVGAATAASATTAPESGEEDSKPPLAARKL